jgi:hypothetical protein
MDQRIPHQEETLPGWDVSQLMVAEPPSPWPCNVPRSVEPLHRPSDADPNMAVAAAMYAGFNAGLMAAMSHSNEGLDAAALASAWVSTMTAQHQVDNSYPVPTPALGRRWDGIAPPRKSTTVRRTTNAHSATFSHLQSKPKSVVHCDNASDISTTVSSASQRDTRTPSPDALPTRVPCHLIWCDQRAFKENSAAWKQQLEARARLPVKAHKTAEKCIRLLRKKQHSSSRPPCVFLISWANAPTLLPYINDSPHVTARAIILVDTDMCRGRGREAAEKLKLQYPFVTCLAASWSEAVEAATHATADLQSRQMG